MLVMLSVNIAWVAPEIIRGLAYNESCDVYSCGVVLFEILTRSEPYISDEKDSDDIAGVVTLMNSIYGGLRPDMTRYLSQGMTSDVDGIPMFKHYYTIITATESTLVSGPGVSTAQNPLFELIPKEIIQRVVSIITTCWQANPEARPSMSDVIRKLEGIVRDIDRLHL